MKGIQVYLFIIFLLNSFGLIAQTDSIPSDWKKVIEEEYTFSYPTDWYIRQTGEMGTSFILFSPAVHPDNAFNENINLIIQDNSQYQLNLEQYIDISVKQLANFYADLDIKYNQAVRMDDQVFQRLLYAGTLQEKKLQYLQYIWVSEKSVHILTATCLESSFDMMATYLEEIMQTFRPIY